MQQQTKSFQLQSSLEFLSAYPLESDHVQAFSDLYHIHSLSQPLRIEIKTKRNDIQCWRSLAIIGVLLFHIWPEWFPNGYLGVDIFFVISGFLMSTILHDQLTINKSTMIGFYYRRIKRIAPIYLIFLVVTVIWVSQILWKEEFKSFLKDSFWASVFMTNFQNVFEEFDYFDIVRFLYQN